jgi:hypothetical protein
MRSERYPDWREVNAPGMELGCNKDGLLFFRQLFPTQWITWHIYPKGELLLREWGIDVGDLISPDQAKILRAQDVVYWLRGGLKVKASSPVETEPDPEFTKFLREYNAAKKSDRPAGTVHTVLKENLPKDGAQRSGR